MNSLRFEKVKGHIVLPIASRRALLDTGSPVSVASSPFEFLGQSHSPSSNIMGFPIEKLSEISGMQIDILLGCDILSGHDMRIRWSEGMLDFDGELHSSATAAPMETLMMLRIFAVNLKGQHTKAIFDTGAHLSYIDIDLVRDEIPVGQKADFYPMVSRSPAGGRPWQNVTKGKVLFMTSQQI